MMVGFFSSRSANLVCDSREAFEQLLVEQRLRLQARLLLFHTQDICSMIRGAINTIAQLPNQLLVDVERLGLQALLLFYTQDILRIAFQISHI